MGVVDVAPAAAAAFAGRTGARTYPDRAALLDDAPDAVWVCVPPFAHGEPERDLIARGIPFFVEKPLAADLAVAEELAAAIARRGLLTATGYHWRYLEAVRRARERLAGAPPRLAIGAWLDRVPPAAWWPRRARSGGQVVEQATHLLDVMLHLVGDVAEVHAVAGRWPRAELPGADVDDVTAATLRFASGAVGSLAATSLLADTQRAALELVGEGVRVTVADDADWPARVQVDADFVAALRGETPGVRAPYAEALRTHRLGLALARSARDGRPVSLTPVAR